MKKEFEKLWQDEMEIIASFRSIEKYPPNFTYLHKMCLRIIQDLLDKQEKNHQEEKIALNKMLNQDCFNQLDKQIKIEKSYRKHYTNEMVRIRLDKQKEEFKKMIEDWASPFESYPTMMSSKKNHERGLLVRELREYILKELNK